MQEYFFDIFSNRSFVTSKKTSAMCHLGNAFEAIVQGYKYSMGCLDCVRMMRVF